MGVHVDMERHVSALSNAGLVELLTLAVEIENEKLDDVHTLAISGAHQYRDSHESGAYFSMIDRVLESASQRQYIDALIAELATRMNAGPDATQGDPPEPSAQFEPPGGVVTDDKAPTKRRDRERHARQAMSYLLMTMMELHSRSGTSEQAYDLADKALTAIGALR